MADDQDDLAEDQIDDQPEGEEDEVAEAEDGEGEEAEADVADAEDEGEVEEPPKKKPASATIRELRERAQRTERELEELKQRVSAPAPRDTAKEEADERAALAAMTDQEKTQYFMAKEIRHLKQQVGQVGLQTHDATDRASFSAYLTANPRFEKYRDEVERLHREHAARGGGPVNREFLLSLVVGQAVLKAKPSVAKQKRAAAQRVNGQRVGGGSVRSNTGAAKSKGGSLVQRMEEQDIAI